MDILIYAKEEIVEHKMQDNVPADIYCYWSVGTHPNLKVKNPNNVYFSNGKKIFAKGIFLGNDYYHGKKAIYFLPLKKVNIKQPKKPPTRGWCYINVDSQTPR